MTDSQLDALIANAYRAGAGAGIMESHRLLQCCGQNDAAERLLKHWDSIINRATVHEQASAAIAKAKRV